MKGGIRLDKEKETEFNSAYDLYADMLYKIAFLHTADKDESEDILQEVFIKLLYKSPSFKSSEHKKAWLIKTTVNQCKDFLKSSRRKVLPLNDEILGDEPFDERKLDVRNKLLKLDAKYKTVLFLYYYEDYTVEMIATTLSLSKSNVKMRLKRGRELLKNELEEYSNDEKKIIKEAIDDIKPDVYMKTRLQAKIEEPKRKSAKSLLKPVLSCTLALAVLMGVGSYGMTRDKMPATTQASSAKISDHSFNIVAYAQDNGKVEERATLSNDVLSFPSYKLRVEKVNGDVQISYDNSVGFNIDKNANIKKVTFESEKGYFQFTNHDLYFSQMKKGNYYVDIELTKDEQDKYASSLEDAKENEVKAIYNEIAKSRDLSKYFGTNSQNTGLYSFSSGTRKDKQVITLTNKKLHDEIFKYDRKITVNADDLQKELNENALWYDNENATDTLLKNPDIPFEKLEGDTITVTAEFKDGQQATKKIKTSFNSKGELQLQYVK